MKLTTLVIIALTVIFVGWKATILAQNTVKITNEDAAQLASLKIK